MHPNSLANLKPPFSKERQPQGKGRKPSSVRKFVKDNNVDARDVSAMAKYIIPLTSSQITDLAKDDTAPFMMRVFARAVLEDMKKGYLDSILKILDRAVGKPIETLEHTGKDGGPILTKHEREERLKELLGKKLGTN